MAKRCVCDSFELGREAATQSFLFLSILNSLPSRRLIFSNLRSTLPSIRRRSGSASPTNF